MRSTLSQVLVGGLLGCLLIVAIGHLPAAHAHNAAKAAVVEDFESGSVVRESYPDQDHDPGDWSVSSSNTYGGADYALRIWGNSWKTQQINPVAVADSTIWQIAVFTERRGEMGGFGIGDGTNELFYTFTGRDLPGSTNWWTVYQGAFPLDEWYAYLLPVGDDWLTTFGYLPTIDRLVYVNDADDGQIGEIFYDAIADVTEDQPIAPQANILYTIEGSEKVAKSTYRIDVQFQGTVFDPDSEDHTFFWDFGDSTSSTEQNPTHQFLVHADYPYTVGLLVRDPDGLAAGDTCQVWVEDGDSELPLTVNFVGDVFTGRQFESNGGIIDTYGIEALYEPTIPIFGDAADVSVANLEVPYTDRGEPHPTKSVVFRSRPENIVGLAYAGIDVVTIGNNHIIDYGEIGMLDTMEGLDNLNIPYSGAGVNEYFALQPCYWTEKGVRMAFLGQCNRTGRQWNYQPFLDAGYNKPGFAFLLPDNLQKSIDFVRDQSDIVIMQTHSGDEYDTAPPDGKNHEYQYPYGSTPPRIEAALINPDDPPFTFRNEPTPGERELRRLSLDYGADVHINHHPHVLQGFEAYNNKLIAHCLGNFIFDLYYTETMPTMVLTLEIEKTGIVGQWFTPAWINHWIPEPATGRLGREIIDRLADYSRPMNAIVVPHYAENLGRIYLRRAHLDSTTIDDSFVTAMTPSHGGEVISPPLELPGLGSLSAVLSVVGDLGGDWEVSWGREILWHGVFEDEGADLWDVNTEDEWIDDQEAHAGSSSLCLRREDNDWGQTGTDLEKHLPCDPTKRLSAGGWLKADNAGDAVIMVRLYESRSDNNPNLDVDLDARFTGTTDWTYQWLDLGINEDLDYFDMRCQNEPPASGTGFAWFDDLKLIEWEDWVPVADMVEVPSPNNYRFLQVRCNNTDVTEATVQFRETSYTPIAVAVPGSDTPVRSTQLANYPNPFNPRTTIELALPGAGNPTPIELTVFDIRGRKIATVFQGELPTGRRHRFSWDGRTAQGARAASGVYFCRAEVGDRVFSLKMTLVQ